MPFRWLRKGRGSDAGSTTRPRLASTTGRCPVAGSCRQPPTTLRLTRSGNGSPDGSGPCGSIERRRLRPGPARNRARRTSARQRQSYGIWLRVAMVGPWSGAHVAELRAATGRRVAAGQKRFRAERRYRDQSMITSLRCAIYPTTVTFRLSTALIACFTLAASTSLGSATTHPRNAACTSRQDSSSFVGWCSTERRVTAAHPAALNQPPWVRLETSCRGTAPQSSTAAHQMRTSNAQRLRFTGDDPAGASRDVDAVTTAGVGELWRSNSAGSVSLSTVHSMASVEPFGYALGPSSPSQSPLRCTGYELVMWPEPLTCGALVVAA